MNERFDKLSGWMKENDVQVTFLTSSESVFYFTGFYSNPHERLLALAVFQDAEPFLVCPAMDKQEARHAGWKLDIVDHSDIDRPWELVQKAIGSRVGNVGNVAIEKEHMNVERYEAISQLFPQATFISAEEKIRVLRMVKDEKELGILREACALADYAIEVGVEEIAEGKSELDVLSAVEFALKKKGVNKMSFSTMVLTGANASAPHGTPGMTKIQRGDLVLFDLGVVIDGYCSDITRTVAFGDISDKQKEIYNTVLKGQLAALDAVKPGVACSTIDLAARNIIADAGYGDYFPHRLGHGLGISVHEYPSMTETNDLKLQEGMVFTIEPGIYVPDVAGVRIEDDVVVTANGVEILTKFPKELLVIK
ncbi:MULTISPECIES: Xaa-Pro peptidase family protein [unclassified Bacillus (in: firmicutes)]|uniref:M24 family metallopeptidase n=1 Tax=unclassified Bacillus (in: firmicutes) TaxID=185979 RepID=UPI0008EB3E23|nr:MULTISPECIES: Xaa-Pro peptidase family protein [unclassified Bacillus (in: firmicutes)]SFB17439.1 Xaa-Pro aminopeptidase. Metallo peptidase. MEROPS family M24B [Bacillus sp. UNCCL13]SFQ77088.1 Xaa-Pro aminopeptidase. Metallo peptidase. MEROPS family M24B [Bacillus sp. cl95]